MSLYFIHVNGSANHTCGICQQSIVQQGPTTALAHKRSGTKRISKGLLLNKDFQNANCFFHPACIKKVLPNCPTCQITLEPPKGLLSFKERAFQKLYGIKKAVSAYVSPTILKNAVKAGYDGAVKGAQLATSFAVSRLLGFTENSPWADLEALVPFSSRDIENALSKIRNAHLGFLLMIPSHFLVHLLAKIEAKDGYIKEIFLPELKTKEEQLTALGVSQIDKLRLQDEIKILKTYVRNNTYPSSLYTYVRGALLAAIIGTTYIASNFPGGFEGALAGIFIGGVFSTEQLTRFLDHIKESATQLRKPLQKFAATAIGGFLSVALAQSAGIAEEGQAIAGGIGAGVTHSFLYTETT